MTLDRRLLIGGLFVLMFVMCASLAIADPVTPHTVLAITSGRLLFDHDSDDPFMRGQLSGSGFSLFLDLEQTTRTGGPELDLASPFVFGTLTLGGAEIDLSGGTLRASGRVAPTGPSRVVVRGPDDGQFVGIVSFPFSLAATLSGSAADGTPFQVDLLGHGTGRTDFVGFGSPQRNIDIDTVLTFSPAAPTPEPASLLLLAIGVIAVRQRLR